MQEVYQLELSEEQISKRIHHMSGKIQLTIKELKLAAVIGCYDYERANTQPLILDLTLDLGTWSYLDELENTVNYAELHALIIKSASESNFLLVESLAKFLAAELFLRYSQIKKIVLTIRKPEVCHEKDCLIQASFTQKREYKVAIALGSNLNNPRQQLISAIEFISEIVQDIRHAPIYKSSPCGFTEQYDFFNTCISGTTTLEPLELLVALKKIEKRMGKVEQFTNGPRIIDLDILLFADKSYQQLFLQIPHPRLAERDFVLQPLIAIEPTWIHPELQLSMLELFKRLSSNQHYVLQQLN